MMTKTALPYPIVFLKFKISFIIYFLLVTNYFYVLRKQNFCCQGHNELLHKRAAIMIIQVRNSFLVSFSLFFWFVLPNILFFEHKA